MPRCFWSEEDKGFIAVDDLRPGCSAFGETSFIAKCELFDAQTAWDRAKESEITYKSNYPGIDI